MVLAAERWLLGSDEYRLQHSQMVNVACSYQYVEKGRELVCLRQCEQALRVCFQVSGYSWIRLQDCQWVFRTFFNYYMLFFQFCHFYFRNPHVCSPWDFEGGLTDEETLLWSSVSQIGGGGGGGGVTTTPLHRPPKILFKLPTIPNK